MTQFEKMYKFNNFPIHKDKFFELVYKFMEASPDLGMAFSVYPRMYDKIFVTMTQKELLALGKRLNAPHLKKVFQTGDAFFDCKKADDGYIILHVPSMVRELSIIKTQKDDPYRRTLFTIHFFSCLFYELAWANEISMVTVRGTSKTWLSSKGKSLDEEPVHEESLIANARDSEQLYMAEAKKYLDKAGLSWNFLSESLFDWDKLQEHIG